MLVPSRVTVLAGTGECRCFLPDDHPELRTGRNGVESRRWRTDRRAKIVSNLVEPNPIFVTVRRVESD
jgi:hypothetical protein